MYRAGGENLQGQDTVANTSEDQALVNEAVDLAVSVGFAQRPHHRGSEWVEAYLNDVINADEAEKQSRREWTHQFIAGMPDQEAVREELLRLTWQQFSVSPDCSDDLRQQYQQEDDNLRFEAIRVLASMEEWDEVEEIAESHPQTEARELARISLTRTQEAINMEI